MNKFFIINGSGGSGKDTFVRMCKEIVNKYCEVNDLIYDYDYQVLNYSSVDLVKKAAKLLMGKYWDEENKTEKNRKFLSDLCDVWDSVNGRYLILRDMINSLNNTEHGWKFRVIFIHIREPEMIEVLQKEYPEIESLIVLNNNITHIKSNHADAEVYNYEYDHVIDNSGSLEDLYSEAYIFISKILKDLEENKNENIQDK